MTSVMPAVNDDAEQARDLLRDSGHLYDVDLCGNMLKKIGAGQLAPYKLLLARMY
jgi:hypothetical protein